LLARWRSAPTVRFIGFEILATGVFAFECLRNSASCVFDQTTCVLFVFFVITNSLFCWKMRGVAHPFNECNPIALHYPHRQGDLKTHGMLNLTAVITHGEYRQFELFVQRNLKTFVVNEAHQFWRTNASFAITYRCHRRDIFCAHQRAH